MQSSRERKSAAKELSPSASSSSVARPTSMPAPARRAIISCASAIARSSMPPAGFPWSANARSVGSGIVLTVSAATSSST